MIGTALPASARLALAMGLLAICSCTRPPWPSQATGGDRVLARLEARSHEITSATYRVRWRAQGTEPHSEFILEIAYKAPGRFRISATGPFDVPAFTAVVIEEDFWFVDHHNGEFVADQLGDLDRYDVPLSSFFTGLWRDLFAGGWGGNDVVSLIPASKRNRYEAAVGNRRWLVHWNHGKEAPRQIIITEETPEGTTVAETWFHRMGDDPPYWQIERIELRGFPGGGRHRWKMLEQEYNMKIPDRFFAPLRQPPSAAKE